MNQSVEREEEGDIKDHFYQPESPATSCVSINSMGDPPYFSNEPGPPHTKDQGPSPGMSMKSDCAKKDSMLGKTLTLETELGDKKIQWKQGCKAGFGGDRSQDYHECTYRMTDGKLILVYIQSDRPIQKSFKVDSECQFGKEKGVVFLVIHDKLQKPFQHRFVPKPMYEKLLSAHEFQKRYTTVDLAWMCGDHLCNFE